MSRNFIWDIKPAPECWLRRNWTLTKNITIVNLSTIVRKMNTTPIFS